MEKNYQPISTALFFTNLVWLYHGYSFGSGNHGAELLPIMSIINPELYKNDFSTQDFLQPGPRFFFYQIIASTSKILNIDLDIIYIILKITSHISFFLAIYYITKSIIDIFKDQFKSNYIYLNILTTILIIFCSIELNSWGNPIFRTDVVPSTIAMSIAIWSLFFAIQKSWLLAFTVCGVATFLQPLVGFYAGLVLIPALVFCNISIKSYMNLSFCILIWIAPIIIIYIMSQYDISRSPSEEFDFLRVFGEFRVPHHWFPSSGSWHMWLSDIMFVIAAFISLRFISVHKIKTEKRITVLLSGSIILSIFGVLINVIFVELFPIEFIGKLQFQRVIPFGQLYMIISVLLMIFLIISSKVEFNFKYIKYILLLFLLITPLLTLYYVYSIFHENYIYILFTVLFLLGCFIFFISSKNFRNILLFFTTILIVFLNSNYVKFLPYSQIFDDRYNAIYDREKRENPLYRWIYENTDKDEVIVIPPDWSQVSESLAFNSQRAVYFSFKNVPYSDYGVEKWSNRAELLLGQSILSESVKISTLRQIWNERSSSDIVDLMNKIGACYLVDRTHAREDIKLKRVYQSDLYNNSENWSIWINDMCE